jgi:hypothetical protein
METTEEKRATFTPSEEVTHEVHKLLLEHDDELSEYHIGIVSRIIGGNYDKLREVLAKVEGGEG